MPRLIRHTSAPVRGGPATSGAGLRSGLGFGVPPLAHPLVAPAEWAELARPGAPLHWAAFDVARGPGSRADPLYAEVVGRVRENGVPVLGLLDIAHGARPFAELVSDASRYLDWYRVDGFYLDRAPTGQAEADECSRTALTLRALLGGGPEKGADKGPDKGSSQGSSQGSGNGILVLNPGVYPHPDYAGLADQLVAFNGPWNRYRWSEAPQWTAGHPQERFVHLVHGLPRVHLETALRIARWQGAGTLWLTDRDDSDPWAGLPGYWPEVVRKVRKPPPPSM